MTTNINTVLVGTGNSGDFVRQQQGTAKAEGFSAVSRLWYPKTLSFDDGFEAIERDRSQREDVTTSLDCVNAIINENGRFAFAFDDGREFIPNDHALRQAAVKLGIPITTVNHLTGEWSGDDGVALLRNTFNVGIRRHNDDQNADDRDQFVFRTYNGDSLRAVLTDSFAAIDNRWFLELLSQVLPGGRLSHWRGNADEIFGNVLIPDTIREESDSDYGGMISVTNSEIGTARISQMPSLFRAICQNGTIWDAKNGNTTSQVHRGKIDLQLLAKRIVSNINEQIPLLSKIIDQVLTLRCDAFAIGETKIPQVFAAMKDAFKLTPSQARGANDLFVKHESDNRNLFGVIQGLTRQSQLETNEQWLSIDKLAGNLSQYDAATWSNFLTRAKTYSDKQIAESLGLSV